MIKKHFYYMLIEAIHSDEENLLQAYWTWADDIGEAIDRVLAECRAQGVNQPLPREIDPVSSESLPDYAQHGTTEGVFYNNTIHTYPKDDAVILPPGVIKSCQEGEFDIDEITEGFEVSTIEGDLYAIDIVLNGGGLKTTYFNLIRCLPEIRVTWLTLSPQWGNRNERVFWANKNCNSPSLVEEIAFDKLAVLENGLIDLTVYADEGETNLNLDSHKTIKVTTRSTVIRDALRESLLRQRVPEQQDLKSIEYGMYHWHYQPHRSIDRESFECQLKQLNFGIWKTEPAD